MSKDSIIITGLSLHGNHGILPAEIENGSRYLLIVEFSYDVRAGVKADDIEDAIDYRSVIDVAKRAFSNRRCNLIETVAERIAQAVLGEFLEISSITVHLMKTQVIDLPEIKRVEVKITRAR